MRFVIAILFLVACSSVQVKDGYIYVTDTGKDLEDAKRNARRQIIENGIGQVVKSQSISASSELKTNIITAASEGYVTEFDVLEMSKSATGVNIKAKGKANEKAIGNALHGRYADLGKPKMMLVISEEVVGNKSNSDNKTEGLLQEKLISDFDVMDKEQTKKILGKQSGLKDAFQSERAFQELMKVALEEEMGLLVLGKTKVSKGAKFSEDGNVYNYISEVSLRIVDVGNGKILASKTEKSGYPHIDPAQGSFEGIKQVIAKVYPEMIEQIKLKWKPGGTIRVIFEGISYDAFLEKDVLSTMGKIPGVNAVNDRGQSVGKTIVVEVDAMMDGNKFYRLFRDLKSEVGINFSSKFVKGNTVHLLVKK